MVFYNHLEIKIRLILLDLISLSLHSILGNLPCCEVLESGPRQKVGHGAITMLLHLEIIFKNIANVRNLKVYMAL